MALNTFKDVQNLLDAFVAQNNLPISGAPHGAFWQTSYPVSYTHLTLPTNREV